MFERVKNALLEVEKENVFHYFGFKEDENYIVWQEQGQADSTWANGRMKNQAIRGQILYYVFGEDDESIPRLQKALSDNMISFHYDDTQIVDGSDYICHVYSFQVVVNHAD